MKLTPEQLDKIDRESSLLPKVIGGLFMTWVVCYIAIKIYQSTK